MTNPIQAANTHLVLHLNSGSEKSDLASFIQTAKQTQEILQAKILDIKTNGQLLLDIAGRKFTAQTKLPLQVGQTLPVQFQGSDKQIQLKILPDLTSPLTSILQQAIRQTLPKQMQFAPLFNNIQFLRKPEKQLLPKIPLLAQRHLKSLTDNFSSAKQLSQATGVKQAILNSGLFLESKIAKHNDTQTPIAAIKSDFKAKVYQIIETLKQYQNSKTNTQEKTGPESKKQDSQITENPMASLKKHKVSKQNQNPMMRNNPIVKAATTKLTATNLNQNETKANTQMLPGQKQVALMPGLHRTANAPLTHSITAPDESKHSPSSNQSSVLTIQKQPTVNLATLQNIIDPEEAIDEIIRQLTGSLAKLQYTQLTNLTQDLQSPLHLYVDIPIQEDERTDILQLQIHEEEKNESTDPNERTWHICMAFDLPDLGMMQVSLTLKRETLSATLWTEKNWAKELIDKELSHLRTELEHEGIVICELDCHLGSSPHFKTPDPLSLLDTKV